MLRTDTIEMMNDLLNGFPEALDATMFSRAWFDGVEREGGDSFFNHQLRVTLVIAETGDLEAAKASICHDVWEDPNKKRMRCSYKDLHDVLGDTAFQYVWWLTSPDKCDERLAAAPREYRKLLQRRKMAGAPAMAQLIKFADRADNLESMTFETHSPEFCCRYVEESAQLIRAMWPYATFPYCNEDYRVFENLHFRVRDLFDDWKSRLAEHGLKPNLRVG